MSEDRSLFSVPAVAYTLAILCTVLWGSAFPSIKLGYELFQIDPSDTWSKLVYAAVRFTLAGVLVLVVRLFVIQREQRVRIASLKGEQWGRLALLGLLQTTIHYYFFYISLSFITGAKGSILSASNVFWSAILAHLFFHNDKISRGKILGIIAGFASVILVNYDVDFGFEFSVQGELFIADCGISCLSLVCLRQTTHSHCRSHAHYRNSAHLRWIPAASDSLPGGRLVSRGFLQGLSPSSLSCLPLGCCLLHLDSVAQTQQSKLHCDLSFPRADRWNIPFCPHPR